MCDKNFIVSNHLIINCEGLACIGEIILLNNIKNYSSLVEFLFPISPDLAKRIINCYEELFPFLKPYFDYVKGGIEWQ